MKQHKKQFAMCVRNEEADDLEIRKVYRVLPDVRAAKDGLIRVIDESGESVRKGVIRKGVKSALGS